MPKGRHQDRDHRKPNPKASPKRSRETPKAIKGLVNARLMHFEFPETFEVPSDSEIKKMKPGNMVKVARKNERFWVRIDGFVGRKWHGTVLNNLFLQEDLKKGDSIYFMRKHIYDIGMN